MNNVLKELLKEFDEHKGEFVLNGTYRVYRLIGISEDDFDYSYVLYDGRNLSFETPLIKLIYLKGKIDKEDYEGLEKSARLNHENCFVEDNGEILDETPEQYKNNLIQKYPFEIFHTDLIFKSEKS